MANVQQEIAIPKDAKIENYSLAYDSNGEIRDIYFELIAQEEGLVHYRVQFIKSEQVYRINAQKIDQWIQYNRLMLAEQFFQLLDTVDLREIRPEGDFEWLELRSQGSMVSYGIENTQKYVIKQGEITEITNDQLPITGFYLSSYGMKKVKESGDTTAYEGQGMRDYLFDVSSVLHKFD